jgi:hypothetical protein
MGSAGNSLIKGIEVQEIIDTFDSFHAQSWVIGNAMLGLVAQTLAETEENFIRSRKIDGVQNVKMLVLKDTKDFSEWLDREIERKIVETSKLPQADVDIVTSNTS